MNGCFKQYMIEMGPLVATNKEVIFFTIAIFHCRFKQFFTITIFFTICYYYLITRTLADVVSNPYLLDKIGTSLISSVPLLLYSMTALLPLPANN